MTSESVDVLTFLVGEYSRSLHGRDFLLFPGEAVPSSEECLLERGEFSWLLLLGVFLWISTLNSGSVLTLRGGFSPGLVSEVAILTSRRRACFADCFSSYALIFCSTIVFVNSGNKVSGFMVFLLIIARSEMIRCRLCLIPIFVMLFRVPRKVGGGVRRSVLCKAPEGFEGLNLSKGSCGEVPSVAQGIPS